MVEERSAEKSVSAPVPTAKRSAPTPTPPGTSFPRRFGSYVLLEQIANDPAADTFLGLTGSGVEAHFVTIKIGRSQAGRAPDAETARRATATRRAGCPNLLALLDVGDIEGQPYLAMEHVDGRDLGRILARARKLEVPVPVDVAAYVVREIARALNHLHLVGDPRSVATELGPERVLVSFTGEVKVVDLDFGAPPEAMGGGEGGRSRWHDFQAPERLADLPFDHRADVYTAGVLLWETLTNQALFQEEGIGKNPHLVVARETVPTPSSRRRDVPRALDEIVLKALAFDPAKRYRDAEALRAALAEFVLESDPPTDAGTVALFLQRLFGDEIEDERVSRQSARTEAQWLFQGAEAKGGGFEAKDPLIGSVVAGRYLIQGFCGAGGIGRVYRAQHVEIGRLVALKVLDPDFTDQDEVLARFEQEARVGAIHHHPNVVQVTDAGHTKDGRRFFVMDFVDGSTLHDVLEKSGPFDVSRATRVALEVAHALEALHAAGVIHRDINPSNVMLTARPGQPEQVKVVDFGVAKILAMADSGVFSDPKSSDPRLIAGTPRYLAPEQAQGKRADARVDVYAVGELLYEMLIGRVPWHGNDVTAILRAKIERDVLPAAMVRAEIPQELDDIITRALARDPDKRVRSMKDLRLELEAFARAYDPTAPRPSRTPGETPPGEPSTLLTIRAAGLPWRHLGILFGAAVVVLILGVVVLRRPDEVPPPPRVAAQENEPARAAPPPVAVAPSSVVPGLGRQAAAAEPELGREARGEAPSAEMAGEAHGAPEGLVPGAALDPGALAPAGANAVVAAEPGAPTAAADPALAGARTANGSAVPAAGRVPTEARRAPVVRRPVTAPSEHDVAQAVGLAQQANEALERREYAAAIQLGQRAVALAPTARAYVVLGQAYLMVRRVDDARTQFRRAAALDPRDPEVKEGLRATADAPHPAPGAQEP